VSSTSDLIVRIEAYCQRHGMAATTFGRLAVNDGKLVGRLRGGRSITLDTLRRIEAVLQERHAGAAA
jgi:hypothetical protein